MTTRIAIGRPRVLLSPATAILVIMASATIACADAPFRRLGSTEIAARFAGMSFTDEVHFTRTFTRDGTLATVSMGTRRTGRWRVVDDELCLTRASEEERCHQVWTSGRNVQLRRPGFAVTEDGILRKPAAHD